MNARTPRVAVMQDLSCIGRCSLGVAMAVLPAMGVEAAVLPTALLSAHTAFDGFTFTDLSPELERIIAHWKQMDLHFDAIYIGYLGSKRLIELAERVISLFGEGDVRVILDPAFGDHGRLYAGFDGDYVRAMRLLCARADITLPNLTEACRLLELPYDENAAPENLRAQAKAMLGGRLRDVLITSCPFPDGRTGLICAGEHAFSYPHSYLSMPCHGSGDLFASVFTGLLVRCNSVERAARMAADFTRDCIRNSMTCPDHRWYGVDFEAMLPELARRAAEI